MCLSSEGNLGVSEARVVPIREKDRVKLVNNTTNSSESIGREYVKVLLQFLKAQSCLGEGTFYFVMVSQYQEGTQQININALHKGLDSRESGQHGVRVGYLRLYL